MPIVYIDESGFAHDMPRTHGYAKIGERCFGTHDWGAKGRTNVIGALIGKSLLTLALFDCTINTATNMLSNTISVGNNPIDVEIASDGNFAYVTGASSDSLSVIDIGTSTVSATIGISNSICKE
ncbi:transposase [Candidatus Neptunichlamydia sp. REUL1]|uniref:transposase n=1 Tax=Candidatus Neptunichlamydia sp. REUL1 TaxID=3064277 RepID=UPI0030B93837